MRKNAIYGSILSLLGLVLIITFLLDLLRMGYPFSILGSLLGLLLVVLGAWTVTRKAQVVLQVERRHERPRSDKPVIGN